MKKKQKGIMVWIIIWAGLLIVVLYSPIGSPGLYSSQDYYVEYQSVPFTKGAITNAPKTTRSQDNNSNELNIPDISTITKSNYEVASYPVTTSSLQGLSYGTNQTQTYQNNTKGAGGFGGSGSFVATRGGSSRSTGTSGIVMTNGITTMSAISDGSNPNKQGAPTGITALTGGTDPGGDPTGDPIPVGDGWGLLILFGVCYAVYKYRLLIICHLKYHLTNRD